MEGDWLTTWELMPCFMWYLIYGGHGRHLNKHMHIHCAIIYQRWPPIGQPTIEDKVLWGQLGAWNIPDMWYIISCVEETFALQNIHTIVVSSLATCTTILKLLIDSLCRNSPAGKSKRCCDVAEGPPRQQPCPSASWVGQIARPQVDAWKVWPSRSKGD